MRSWAARWKAEIVLALIVLLLTAPVVQVLMAHQSSRLAFTAAVVDHHTVQIDAYEGILGVDFAQREGHLYSDKAPGQPLLAAPFYALARALGAEGAEAARPFDNLTLWWVSLWSATIPGVALAILMRRFCLRVTGDGRASTIAALAMATSTMLLPFSTVLFSHVLVALLGFAAYYAAAPPFAAPDEVPSWRIALGGFLGGFAVFTEYTAGIIVLVVGLVVLRRFRLRGAAAYVLGGVPSAIGLGIYNTIAWGSPLEFGYKFSGSFSTFHSEGFFGVRIPSPSLTFQVLFGERGLLTITPILLAGVIGLWLLAREQRTREVGVVGLVVFGAYVLLQGGWFSVTAGASPGPRYAVAALGFVAVGVAKAWQEAPRWTLVAFVVGLVTMLLGTWTNPLAQPTERFTAGHWVWRTLNDRIGDTLFSGVLGTPWSHLAMLLAAALLADVLWSASGPRPATVEAGRVDEAGEDGLGELAGGVGGHVDEE